MSRKRLIKEKLKVEKSILGIFIDIMKSMANICSFHFLIFLPQSIHFELKEYYNIRGEYKELNPPSFKYLMNSEFAVNHQI